VAYDRLGGRLPLLWCGEPVAAQSAFGLRVDIPPGPRRPLLADRQYHLPGIRLQLGLSEGARGGGPVKGATEHPVDSPGAEHCAGFVRPIGDQLGHCAGDAFALAGLQRGLLRQAQLGGPVRLPPMCVPVVAGELDVAVLDRGPAFGEVPHQSSWDADDLPDRSLRRIPTGAFGELDPQPP
jgi:hypothetical protein